MTRPIGYYVHHHGDGHRQRAMAIAKVDPEKVVLLGTGLRGRTDGLPAIDLTDDRTDGEAFDGVDHTPSRPHARHYAPLRHDGVRARMSSIAQWIASARPALLVVDVSVEVAMLARLCSVPVAYVRLSGRRDDIPHHEAFCAASLLIAPFSAALDEPDTPDWIVRKTRYCPGIVPSASCSEGPVPSRVLPSRVLVVAGKGGAPLDGDELLAAARATPDYHWRGIGSISMPKQGAANLELRGWVENAHEEVASAQIVIGAAGDGLVTAVIAAKRPFICIPQPRPYDEQVCKARALQAAGAAIALERWPRPQQWPAHLAAAMTLNEDRLSALGDPAGASHAYELLRAFADTQNTTEAG